MIYLVIEVEIMKRNFAISLLILCSCIIIYLILASYGLALMDPLGLIIVALLGFIISLLLDIRDRLDKQSKWKVR